MATSFLELATTLKYLGANWLPEKKKLILRPVTASLHHYFTTLLPVRY